MTWPRDTGLIADVRREVRELRLAPHRAMDELDNRWRQRTIELLEQAINDPVAGRTMLELLKIDTELSEDRATELLSA